MLPSPLHEKETARKYGSIAYTAARYASLNLFLRLSKEHIFKLNLSSKMLRKKMHGKVGKPILHFIRELHNGTTAL